jgi:hypothetical protein
VQTYDATTVTIDELFVLTLEDLERRVQLGRGEYDALMTALLLRKLLLDGAPLVHQVNRARRLKLTFRMRDETPEPGLLGWGPGESLWPNSNYGQSAVVDLNLSQFLSRPTLVADGHVISVRDLINFMANYAGAVHASRPDDPKTEALWHVRWGEMRFGPTGPYGGCIYELIAIGRITIDGVQDLRTQVQAETWPAGMPSFARGLHRDRDPSRPGAS